MVYPRNYLSHSQSLRITAGALLLLTAAWTQQPQKLAPYYPTPETVVMKMLELGDLKPGEKMFDLGSGDGRIVIAAAQKFHADAVGVEFDKDLCRESRERIRALGLERSAQIIEGDVLRQDYSSTDLITVYLSVKSNEKVRPLLEQQLKKGARIVAHDFEFKSWAPAKVVNVEDDGAGRSHTLYLYRR
jgi:protein-L-isoaspartate O-methyltransferase